MLELLLPSKYGVRVPLVTGQLTFFEQAGLAGGHAGGTVGLDPSIAPVVILSPGVGVQVESSKIESRDVQQCDKVGSLAVCVRICAITGETETLDARRDQVVGVEALDVRRGSQGPVVDDTGVAAVAAGLIAELPGENGRRVEVASNKGLDVGLVLCLRSRIGIPRSFAATEGIDVCLDATVVVPLVYEGDDQLDPTRLGGRDNVVDTL